MQKKFYFYFCLSHEITTMSVLNKSLGWSSSFWIVAIWSLEIAGNKWKIFEGLLIFEDSANPKA